MKKMVLFLTLLLAAFQLSAQRSTPNKYALVIGVSKFDDSAIIPLQYSDSDAVKFYQFLRKGYLPGMKPENIRLVTGDSARYSVVEDLITNWLMRLRSSVVYGDHIYIYWSGHGTITRSGQNLLCRDTRYEEERYTGGRFLEYTIGISRLKDVISGFMEREGVKVFLIIDACRTKESDLDVIPAGVLNITQTPVGESDIYFYSCSNGGPSYETEQLIPGSGVFTYFLLLGLSGAADTYPKDKRVSIGEIERFLNKYISEYVTNVLKKDIQQPSVFLKNNEHRKEIISVIATQQEVARQKRIADSIMQLITRAAADDEAPAGVINQRGLQKPEAALHYRFQSGNAGTVPLSAILDRPITDSIGIYDSMMYAIARNQLVEPHPNAAVDYYYQLLSTIRDSVFVDNARRKLVIALLEKGKKFIETYLDGQLPSTKKEVFDLACREMSLFISLRPKGDPFTQDFFPKLQFLKARALAGSSNPADWAEGLRIIDSSLEKNKTAYMYHTKGILYSNKGRYFTAKKLFDTAVSYAPKWTYAIYNRAEENRRLQEFDESIKDCQLIIEKNPGFSRAYSLLGSVYETLTNYRNLDNYAQSVEYNKKALQVDPANTTSYGNLGRVYSKILTDRESNLDSARKYFRSGAYGFNDEYCYTMLGKMFDSNIGLSDSSEYYYKKALAINPYYTPALGYYAEMLRFAGYPAKADSLFLHLIDEEEPDYRLLTAYRSFIFRNRSPLQADSLFRRIIRFNNEDPTIFLNHSKQYEDIDSLEKAKQILHEGLLCIKKSPSLNYAMGALFLKIFAAGPSAFRADDSAVYYFNRVYEMAPQYSLVNYELSRLYLLRQQNELAAFHGDKAKELDKNNQRPSIVSAQLLTQANKEIASRNYSAAIGHLTQVLLLKDDKFESNFLLARVYYLTGKLDSARFYHTIAADESGIPTVVQDNKNFVLDELKGLIEMEAGNWNNALIIFRELDMKIKRPTYIEQAICYYKLYRKKSASHIETLNLHAVNDAMASMMANEGIKYSSKFINEMRSTNQYLVRKKVYAGW